MSNKKIEDVLNRLRWNTNMNQMDTNFTPKEGIESLHPTEWMFRVAYTNER